MALAVFSYTPAHPITYRDRRPVRVFSFAGSESEQRVQLNGRKLRTYRWRFRVDSASGTREGIDAFFEARGFGAESFLVKDLKDYRVAAVALGTSIASQVLFPLPTTGARAGDYPSDIAYTRLLDDGVSIGRTVQTDNRTLTANSAPAAGSVMTADVEFYRRVKLADEYEWAEPVFGIFETEILLAEVAPS